MKISSRFWIILISSMTVVGCAGPGRYVDVSPVYDPVQQVHQNFFLEKGFQAKDKRIAIMDFKGREGHGQVFADTLAAELFKQGLKVVERQNVDVMLQEMRMAQAGAQAISDTELLRKIGQMAGVDIIIVGGIVAYDESIEAQLTADRPALPFTIIETPTPKTAKNKEAALPPGWVVYRWTPGAYKKVAGLPVFANIYASARAIDVATGKIVWIDTVNVQTSGITSVTGLERLGRVMAGNLAGSNSKTEIKYIWDGEEFAYPANWDEVQEAWGRFMQQQLGLSQEVLK